MRIKNGIKTYQKPIFYGLQDFLEAAGEVGNLEDLEDRMKTEDGTAARKTASFAAEEYDMKFQFNEELWTLHFQELCAAKSVIRKRALEDYSDALREMHGLDDEDALMRLMAYKTLPDICSFACDGMAEDGERGIFSNWLIREVYRKLWGWLDWDWHRNPQRERGPEETTVYRFAPPGAVFGQSLLVPVTMHSFWMPFCAYLIAVNPDLYMWNTFRDSVMFNVADKAARCTFNQKEKAAILPTILEVNETEILPEVREFAALTHSIGNMMLVPEGFRGSYGRNDDLGSYWNLALENLKTSGLLERMPFKSYINSFFLWDYVDGNGNVKPLFSGHSKQHIHPETIEECREYFANINRLIRRRGLLMVKLLKLDNEQKKRGSEIVPWAARKVRRMVKRFDEEERIPTMEEAWDMLLFI